MGFFSSLLGTPERRITLALGCLLAALYVPFAGNYGMWDPWETHYSEVARQMLMRHDFVSLWWPGSPQDRNEFWSKPVLTFWLMAIGMGVAGLERVGHQFDGEMAVGWTAEWAVRIPFVLCGLVCAWAVWELTRRVAGRRAGVWATVVLATSSQFFFVARQAMTDMAFVAPIAVALCFAGLALLLPASEVEAELPRREAHVGRLRLSWPRAPIFYVCVGLVLLFVLPQLYVISTEVQLSIPMGRRVVRVYGIVPMLPWIGALVGYLVLATRARCRRQLYFHIAFLMGGVSTLAKGPAGIALPVIVVVVYLVVQGELGRLLPRDERRTGLAPDAATSPPPPASAPRRWAAYAWRTVVHNPLEVGAGTLLFVAVAFPWYHAMLIRHGMGFWNEFIGDNYVHRAAGRHGDRGTFEYYMLQLGQGMFPWCGVVAAAAIASLWRLGRRVAADDARAKLRGFALVWFLVMFATMTLVNTKFHHYILPALPGLAILAGLFLDELVTSAGWVEATMLLVIGVPVVALAGRDLALFPARLSWLFDYDYVNAPGGGRPWPPGAEYEYGGRVMAFAIVAALATVTLALAALWRRGAKASAPVAGHDVATGERASREGERLGGDVAAGTPLPGAPPVAAASAPEVAAASAPEAAAAPEVADDRDVTPGRAPALWVALLAIPVATTVAAELWQPPFVAGPHPLASGWILVGAAGALVLLCLVGRGLARRGALSLAAMGVFACVWTGWGLDRLLTDMSPHWSQKHVIASYYLLRKSEDEPLIAWNMYWRGETFYSKNAIYDHRIKAEDKTVFLGDHNAEKLQQYFASHRGRRVFFIVERSRLESLRQLLPEASRASLKTLDETNNKIYLAVAQI